MVWVWSSEVHQMYVTTHLPWKLELFVFCWCFFLMLQSNVCLGIPNHHQIYCLFDNFCNSTTKRTSKDSHYWLFVRGIHRWPVNSPHKKPIIQKVLPSHGVIMELEWHPVFMLTRHLSVSDMTYKWQNKKNAKLLAASIYAWFGLVNRITTGEFRNRFF